MPKLYSSDVQLGQPVALNGNAQAPSKHAPPKKGKAKLPPTPDNTPEPQPASSDAPKRTLTEEQKQKMKEARERKKQEKMEQQRLQADQAAERVRLELERVAAAQKKKEEANARRRENRLKRKAESQNGHNGHPESPALSDISSVAAPDSEHGDVPPAAQLKKQRKAAPKPNKSVSLQHAEHGETPPPWFTKFVAGFKSEQKEQEGLKTSKKQLKAEAEQEAKQKWNDQITRGRIQSEVDGHLRSMYDAIFR